MILAAGRGERMRPLTDHTPKPLLTVKGMPLLQWSIESLAQSGHTDVVINTAWLDVQIKQSIGAVFTSKNGPVRIHYSDEAQDFGGALETAGGVVRALPMLDEVFWVVAGDVWMPDFVFFSRLLESFRESEDWAHLWLVPNPNYNLKGDFGISSNGKCFHAKQNPNGPLYTFSTVALYKRKFFDPAICDLAFGNPTGARLALAPLLRHAMELHKVSGTIYNQSWTDVGTPERLNLLNSTP
ncbi:MAG: nucleotidyltransferase family protein [Limnohabitans sp.]|nr:nucleotidyltransferase family protein [Limnohabitans sp.]